MADNELRMTIRAKDEASGVLKNFGDVAKTAIGVAIGTFVLPALKALAGQLGSVFTEAAAAEDAQMRLGAVLKSTGGIAGVTAQMANELATSLGQVTRFEDDTIVASEALLLTFTNIGKDVFPQAIVAATDMATVLKTDLDSSVRQLGRALNDPIQGMSALTRMGVQFSEEQKKVITALVESGDVAGAQAVILEQLRVKFGGAAEAAGKTFAGQLAIAKNNIGNLKEAIGLQLLPVLTTLIREFNTFVTTVTPAVGVAVGMIWQAFTGVIGGAEGWGVGLGTSFANGLLAAVPYIVGVIRAIGRVIRHWFAPGSPPLIAEDIDTWGTALVQEYFKAFSNADLSPVISFSRELSGLLSDALGFGLVGESQVAGMLAPLKEQFTALFAEFGRTGAVASFAGLRSAAGPLAAQVEAIARKFLGIGATGAEAGGSADAAGKTAEELEKGEEAAGGMAKGLADAQAALDELFADMTSNGPGAIAAAFDTSGMDARAEEIANSITDKLFPSMDDLKINVTGWIDDIAEALEGGDWEAVGEAVVTAMGEVAYQMSEVGVKMGADFVTWANSKGQAAFAGVGEALGKALVGAIVGFFTPGDPAVTSQPILLAIIGNLANGLKGIIGAEIVLAVSFVAGIWSEIITAIHGKDSQAQADSTVQIVLDSIKQFFAAKLSVADWLHPMELFRKLFSSESWAPVGENIKMHIQNDIVQPIKDILGIKSPSKVFEDIGSDIIEGLVNGIELAPTRLLDSIEGLIGNTLGDLAVWIAGISAAGEALFNLGVDTVNGFIAGIEATPEHLIASMRGLIGNALGGPGGLGEWIAGASKGGGMLFNLGIDIVNGLIDGVRERMGKLVEEMTPPTSAAGDGGGGGGGGSGVNGDSTPPPSKSKSKTKGKGLAWGTSYWGGGMALVGEQGPEVVNLPRGTQVYSNSDSRRMGATWNVTINTNEPGDGILSAITYLQALGAGV